MTIETDRLRLRPFKNSDAAGLLAYLGNPRVNCFKGEQLSTVEEAERLIAEKMNDDFNLAICLKDTDEVIGDMFAVKDDEDTFSVGWHINQLFEGRSYAYEAAVAFLDYLFSVGGARRIYGYVEEDNIRSRNLCERLGMRYEGCLIDFISFVNNPDGTPRYENTCIYAVLKREWDKKQAQ